jgi:colanic acid biosynthesis glycosyl transferase WcaI
MRILIYSANFAPEPVGIGKYSGEMACWLADRGHALRIVAAPPYYPDWKLRPEYRRPRYRREEWRGMSVWRAPLWVPKSPGGLNRILHLLSFAVSSFPLMLRQVLWRPDVVITVAPAFMCAPAGWLTARVCRAQAWLHLQDFEVDIAFELNLLKSKLLRRFALRMERWMLCRFDSVSTISHRMVERLVAKGVPAERTCFFPNWVDTSRIKPSGDGASFRALLGIAPHAVVVLYAGSLGAKQGLTQIPGAAKELAHRENIVFVVCGDGVMKSWLTRETEALPNVHLLPLQSFRRLGDLLCMADIHLLPQNADAADLVLPSKLSGMLASGRPVVATCCIGTELESVVSHCGIVVPPGDQKALGQAIAALADDPYIRVELGRHAREWAVRHAERDTILRQVFGSLGGGETSIGKPETISPDSGSHGALHPACDDATADEFVPGWHWTAVRARGRSRMSRATRS